MGFIVTWGSDTWLSLRFDHAPAEPWTCRRVSATPLQEQRTYRAANGEKSLGQDSSRCARDPRPRGRGRIAIAACALAACAACGPRSAVDKGTRDADGDVSYARALADGLVALPERSQARAIAEDVETRAVREGAGARAAALHSTAARLLERLWRMQWHERDAS